LRARFDTLPTPSALDRALHELCDELAGRGVLNVLMSDGRTLYAFCTKKLFYIVREAPFGVATLIDEDLRMDFSKETGPHDRVAVIASNPLTRDEVWRELPLKKLSAFRNGALV
jgi:glutamine amidotransferase